MNENIKKKIANTMFMKGGNTDAEKNYYSMGAEFGYGLAEQEINRLKGLIEKMYKENIKENIRNAGFKNISPDTENQINDSYQKFAKENNL